MQTIIKGLILNFLFIGLSDGRYYKLADCNSYENKTDCLDEYSLPNRCPLDVAGQISAHQQSLYHLEQLGLKDNLRFTEKNWHDDAPTVRRRYFKEK